MMVMKYEDGDLVSIITKYQIKFFIEIQNEHPKYVPSSPQP